jgi:hypothetical protein
MKQHILYALATALGLGVTLPATAVERPAADGAPAAETGRVECYGPFTAEQARHVMQWLDEAGYQYWVRNQNGQWYVCVRS